MANCYAGLEGTDKTRVKHAHRLGSVSALGYAKTWKTEARAFIRADGSGYVEVIRNGERLISHQFDKEKTE